MTTSALSAPTSSKESTPPHPTFPLNGAVVDGAATTFEWLGVPEATAYHLQVAPDRQFVRDVLELHLGGSTSVALHNTLPPLDRPYFWRIRATSPVGETRWSPYGRFFSGNDAQVDSFRAEKEGRELEERRKAAKDRARKEAELDLIPFIERDDTIPSASISRILGLTMIISFLLVLASVLLATVI